MTSQLSFTKKSKDARPIWGGDWEGYTFQAARRHYMDADTFSILYRGAEFLTNDIIILSMVNRQIFTHSSVKLWVVLEADQ